MRSKRRASLDITLVQVPVAPGERLGRRWIPTTLLIDVSTSNELVERLVSADVLRNAVMPFEMRKVYRYPAFSAQSGLIELTPDAPVCRAFYQ